MKLKIFKNLVLIAFGLILSSNVFSQELKPVVNDAMGIRLDETFSGKIICSQNETEPKFSENLPEGFNLTLINYSNFPNKSNTLSSNMFFSKTFGDGKSSFTMPPNGVVYINVVIVNGQKRIYLLGDVD